MSAKEQEESHTDLYQHKQVQCLVCIDFYSIIRDDYKDLTRLRFI